MTGNFKFYETELAESHDSRILPTALQNELLESYAPFTSVILFCKMFIAFYTVRIVYICIFWTCSTSYCPCDTLMDP